MYKANQVERIFEIVQAQTQAMGVSVFEVGLLKSTANPLLNEPPMLLRTWDLTNLEKSIPWLFFENQSGRDILIRPKGEHALSLLEDLTADALQKMTEAGFTPALIVETSPANFQAWLNHGQVLPKALSTAVARALAKKFGADPGAADWRHFGRLAPFQNRKIRHVREDGSFPEVRLIYRSGETYPRAEEFIRAVETQLLATRLENDRRKRDSVGSLRTKDGLSKTIEDFRRDPRYENDATRIDLAYAVYALSHGATEADVCDCVFR